MYHYISGIYAQALENAVVIDCGGVGYKIFTTYTTMGRLPKQGEKATLYTYLNVREDALDLFGFFDNEELRCFKMLLSVSGVGPKAALSILSEITPEQFALALVSGDAKLFTRASGVGAKLAQRIVLELKDKIKNDQLSSALSAGSQDFAAAMTDAGAEAMSALVVLGYSQSQAREALRCVDTTGKNLEEIIRLTLKQLMK